MMDHESGRWREVDAELFRATLGHFPTGVVLITSLDEAGQPVGMVVGSFTSVSLDPPLVAYLPSRASKTYARQRGSREIVVNVLSADQEWICRRFAAKTDVDKWHKIRTSVTESGVPVLDDVIVSIHCEVERTVEAGDHDIVIGRVIASRLGSPVLPLLFFQGGYGRFTGSSKLSGSEAGALRD
ncbi:flavin reductase family protein [Streptomyces mirabilis]|uniref:flavin reductase family protein n=1 Tax=Streptomyces mirabilis TaxID=68239 RepID=UPI0033F08A1E